MGKIVNATPLLLLSLFSAKFITFRAPVAKLVEVNTQCRTIHIFVWTSGSVVLLCYALYAMGRFAAIRQINS